LSVRGRRRLRALAAVIRNPATTWLGIRMLAWSLVLPVLKYVVPLPLLARLMWSRARRERRPERERMVRLLARRIYKVRPSRHRDNCLERSLLNYRFLSMEGADPHLVVGVRKSERGVVGHAWVLVEGRPLYEAPSRLEKYVTLAEFSGGSFRRAADGALRWPLSRR
jgi:hypothetical protein